MSWEIIVNLHARINLAILYTFTGKFKQAIQVLDPGWSLFYGVIFCFAIYDSYRISVDINKLSCLQRSQTRHNVFTNRKNLTKLNPWLAAVWSALLPGYGHILSGQIYKALILLGWNVSIICFANMHNAIVTTFKGNFELAHSLVDYQWLLFYPSIYVFAIWDSYYSCVQLNKLFDHEQKAYLINKYS